MYPSKEIATDQLLGSWKNRNGTFVLEENGTGYFVNKKGVQTQSITYENHGSAFYVIENGEAKKRTFYLRKNNKAIYELIVDDSRFKSRHIDYQRHEGK